ncbi:ring-cleaving dioxygenase [Chitinophaga sedimenti]|jgi:glyoxalase family protein|uniref:ring-cleaving dioxygenase n=1 Tax=Chitinophaga sedimenti TaxID=2033606 RepID=UPI0020040281|nr:ring-cleaving dioxygenase [Chitinophaga sedimenti]MCK7554840.1 ring-cleaving dioxygenase [Chitinophaga sedimenti]
MENKILGIHHVTAIAGNAKKNLDFYTQTLGMRLVKKTVNFDDPNTYHFYYGNYAGEPGTILTFFPWEGITQGRRGPGQATETGFAVPEGSLDFWLKRLDERNVIFNKPATKFGQEYLTFLDPDGLKLELVAVPESKLITPYETTGIDGKAALGGFHHVTLTLTSIKPTVAVLELLGYTLQQQEVNRYRYVLEGGPNAGIIDLVEAAGEQRGHVAGGSVHHIAFRVKNKAAQLEFQEAIAKKGFNITPVLDRNYFTSVYFREPGGVLFEIATDDPGFAVDEPLDSLGQALKLPEQYEASREQIAKALPDLG